MRNNKGQLRRGFTLVEVLIVVVILGILAATVLPQFTSASEDAKESALVQDLQMLRSQIELYKFQHNGKYPAQGLVDSAKFKDALMLASKADGTTAAVGTAGYALGPYIVGQLPPSPYNGGRGVRVIITDITASAVNEAELDGTELVGWIYNSVTGQLKANATGTTKDGSRNLDAL